MSENHESNDTPATGLGLEGELYYRGTVHRIRYGTGSGFIKTGNGRKIPFVSPFVVLADGRKMDELQEGMPVGYDVGWTSKGLRVTRIKLD